MRKHNQLCGLSLWIRVGRTLVLLASAVNVASSSACSQASTSAPGALTAGSTDSGADACDPNLSCPAEFSATIPLPSSAIGQVAGVTADTCVARLADAGGSVILDPLGGSQVCTVSVSLADRSVLIAVGLYYYGRCCGWINARDTTRFEPSGPSVGPTGSACAGQ
jgi:hypothetical protein